MSPPLVFLVVTGAVLGVARLHPSAPARRTMPRRSPSPTSSPPAAAVPAWFVRLVADLAPFEAERLWTLGRPAAVVVVVVAALVIGPLPTVVLVAAVGIAPRLLRGPLRRRRLARRDALVSPALERLASSLRAGRAPGPAFVEVAGSAPEPLGTELRAVAAEVQHGAALGDALDRWSARPDASPAVVLAASALSLGASTGGEIARSVDRVAATLRERRELQDEVRGLATQARASATLLALAPVAFTLVLASVDPTIGAFLFTDPIGIGCLLAGAGLEATGAAWMARIMSRAT